MENTNTITHTKEEKMALLSAIMYYDGMVLEPNKTLGQNIIDTYGENEEEWDEKLGSTNPGSMTREEAKSVLRAIINDPELNDLVVVSCTREDLDYRGPVCAAFMDDTNKEAIVAFRGTYDLEWSDNGKAFASENSEYQRQALEYFEDFVNDKGLDKNEEYSIYVTGHSKGGNKAMYVTLESEHVDECYAFDGQGFSNEYVNSHGKNIEMNAHKIANYAAENDYVHCLGNSVGETKWLESDMKGLKTPWAHSIGSLLHFDENGKMHLNAPTQQSEFAKALHQATLDMMNEPSPQKEQYFDGVMSLLQAMKTYRGFSEDQQLPDMEALFNDLQQNKENLNAAITYMQDGGYFGDSEAVNSLFNIAKCKSADELYQVILGTKGMFERLGADDVSLTDKGIGVGDTLQFLINGGYDMFQKGSSVFFDTGQSLFDNIVNRQQDIGDLGIDFLQNLDDWRIDGAQNLLTDGYNFLANKFGGLLGDDQENVLEGMNRIWNRIEKGVDDYQELKRAGGDYLQKIRRAPMDAFQSVIRAVGDVYQDLRYKGQDEKQDNVNGYFDFLQGIGQMAGNGLESIGNDMKEILGLSKTELVLSEGVGSNGQLPLVKKPAKIMNDYTMEIRARKIAHGLNERMRRNERENAEYKKFQAPHER